VKVYDSAEVLVELSKHFQPDSVARMAPSQFGTSLRNWLSTASQLLKAAKEFLPNHARPTPEIDKAIEDLDFALASIGNAHRTRQNRL